MGEINVAEWFDDRVYRITIGENTHDIASVTTKLSIESKPFLYKWYAELGWDQAKKKLNDAGERGKRIHYAWYIYMSGGTVIYNKWRSPQYTEEQIKEISDKKKGLICVLSDQSEMVAIWRLQQFDQLVKPKVLKNESTVYSIKKDIAGTLDNAFYLEKGVYTVPNPKNEKKPFDVLTVPESGIYIGDLKSGVVSDSHWAQLAAYTEAFEDMNYGTVAGALILHTGSQKRTGIKGFSALIKTRAELRPHYEIYQHLSQVWKARNPNLSVKAFSFPSIIERK